MGHWIEFDRNYWPFESDCKGWLDARGYVSYNCEKKLMCRAYKQNSYGYRGCFKRRVAPGVYFKYTTYAKDHHKTFNANHAAVPGISV